jgi:CP family cyanate transporter-like MFS transporter
MTRLESRSSTATTSGARVRLVVALVLITLNLRPAISAVSSLLTSIRSDLGLSALAVSVLTTVPTVGLAVFTFLGPRLYGRWGDERLVTWSAFLILAGDLVRLAPASWALFTGTVLIAVGIGVATGAIPGLVKREFPDRVPAMMALYTAVLTAGASLASGVATPLADAMGSSWTGALAVITVPLAVVAGLSWLPRLRVPAPRSTAAQIPPALWRDRMAWLVTLFFSATGFVFYFVLSWLPTVARDRGMDPTSSGLVLTTVALVQIVGSLLVPPVVARTTTQRPLVLATVIANILGLAGVMLAPVPTWVWVGAVVLGLGQGWGFGLAMTLIGLRARDTGAAVGLSGMAQGIGYAISGLGPFATGLLHSAAGGWVATFTMVAAVCVAQLVIGLGAGRPGHVRL